MATPNILRTAVSNLLDTIARRKEARIDNLSEKQMLSLLPVLTAHKIESLALLSIFPNSGIREFYLQTHLTQLNTVKWLLSADMMYSGAIFLQGFPRCLELSAMYTPGMRSDIDIYIPPEHLANFQHAALAAGFDYYGFDDTDIFVVNDAQRSALLAESWANKEVTLTHLQEVTIPDALPIEIADCYLPYIRRHNKLYLMTALEVHHFYLEPRDASIIEHYSEMWPVMGAKRSSLEALIYFNLIRLYKGILHNERRIRLLLDIACLLANRQENINTASLQSLLNESTVSSRLGALCHVLQNFHPAFTYLQQFASATSVETELLTTALGTMLNAGEDL
ncbi:hypothetical protein D3C77_268390 [compost metagenome]